MFEQPRTQVAQFLDPPLISCPYTPYHATLSCQEKYSKTLYHFKIHHIYYVKTHYIMSIYTISCNTIMSKHTISFQNTLYMSCQYTIYHAKHTLKNSAEHYYVKLYYIISKYTILFEN